MSGKKDLRIDDRSTLQNRVSKKLREAILRGYFQPGDRLVQDELAEKLGVSRMPIREALRQLESEGMVVFEPHKGALVKILTSEEIEEIYTLRAMLESLAVQKSVPYLAEKDLADLEELLAEMEDAEDDAGRFIEANVKFHQLLYQGLEWPRLKKFILMLGYGLPNYTPFLLDGQIELSNQEHRRIVAAIRQGDSRQAADLVAKHIQRTGQQLKTYMQQKSETQP